MSSPTDITALDNIIKPVESAPYQSRTGENYVAISSGTGQIIRLSSWNIGGGKKHIYRIYTDDAGQPRAEGRSNTIIVKDPETDDTVNLVVTYQALCPKGKAEVLVSALGRNGSPDNQLRGLISAVADRFLFGREKEFFANFDTLRSELAERICNAIAEETGLEFHAQVRLARDHDLTPHHINQLVEVRFRDSQHAQTISFECDLDVIPQLTLRAIVTYGRLRMLDSELVNAISDHFRLHVQAEAYALNFSDPDVIDGLRGPLNDLASNYGRRVNGLTINAQRGTGYIPPNFDEHTLHAEVKPLGRAEPITLISRIQLTRDDLGLFQKARITDFQAWLQYEFENVIRVVCFEKKYLQYLQPDSWDVIEGEIKAEMISRAKAIGYSVKQIFSAPELKENEYKDAKFQRFELSGLPLRSSGRAHVDLIVSGTLSISDWNDTRIAEKINQGIDLKADITRELTQALSAVLADVTPNDFILKFSEKNESGESVESQLVAAAESKLEEGYKAVIAQVRVVPVDNDEIRRVRDMLNRPKVLKFVSTPLAGPEKIDYSVTWRVCDIEPNSWDKVSHPTCTLEAIEESLKNALVRSFNGLRPEVLYVKENAAIDKLESEAFEHPRREIISHYGLDVALSNLTREWTGDDKRIRDNWEYGEEAKAKQYRRKVDEALRLGDLDTQRDIRAAERAIESTESKFRKLEELRRLPAPNAEQQDELRRLEEEFANEEKRAHPASSREIPSPAAFGLGHDPARFEASVRPPALESQGSEAQPNQTDGETRPAAPLNKTSDTR